VSDVLPNGAALPSRVPGMSPSATAPSQVALDFLTQRHLATLTTLRPVRGSARRMINGPQNGHPERGMSVSPTVDHLGS